MNEFYNVHCTNCGKILSADQMAIDVDKLLITHLSKIASRSRKQVYFDAKRLFDEIRIGLYLTKFELFQKSYLKEDGTLEITCQAILNFIEERYKVKLDYDEFEKKNEKYHELLDSMNVESEDDTISYEDYDDEYSMQEETLETLCDKMTLYAEVDNDAEIKKEYIHNVIRFLVKQKEFVILNCHCEFLVQQDDRNRSLITALKVNYVDNETIAYNHMVCPDCGASFFIDAGKYEERIIVMLGSSRVGKTAYMAALVNELNPEYGQSRFSNITVKDTSDKRYMYFKDNILQQYRQGKKIDKTDESSEAVALFSLEIIINQKTLILTFVDLPGEVFVPRSEIEKAEGEASGSFIINHRKICYSADAFWFCIAPVQIDHELHNINEESAESDKVERDMSLILSNIENTLHIMGSHKTNAPTAVIITRSDEIGREWNLYNSNNDMGPNCLWQNDSFLCDRFRSAAAQVKGYMKSANVKNIVPKLDNMFEKKNYFAVAAYGVKILSDTQNVMTAPYGIILPFLWTLSVFHYLKPVKYVQKVERFGFMRMHERTVEYYEEVEEADLFDE